MGMCTIPYATKSIKCMHQLVLVNVDCLVFKVFIVYPHFALGILVFLGFLGMHGNSSTLLNRQYAGSPYELL